MIVLVTDGQGPFRHRAGVTPYSDRATTGWTGQAESCRWAICSQLALCVSLFCLLAMMGCDDGTSSGLDSALSRGVSADRPFIPNGSATAAQGSPDGPSGDDEPAAGTFFPGRLLVKFKPGASEADQHRVLSRAAGASVKGEIPQIGVKIIELPPHASETAQLRAFGQQAEVEFVELDRVMQPAMIPNDPKYPNAWHLPKIECPQAWDMTTGSSNVTIAILDTGCDPAQPDLVSKYVPGWNFYDNNADTSDVCGHGTTVAGVAAASSNNGIGVAAPAWGCKIMPLRITNQSCCTLWSTVASALTWAADYGVRVANVSFDYMYSTSVTNAAQYMQARGGVVIFGSGNNGTFDSTSENLRILTVSATDQSDLVPAWSDSGNNIDLAAPGVSIYTTAPGGLYSTGSGTSYSAPLVAGVAALMFSANPSLTALQLQDILKQSADDLGPVGWDPQYGWGRLNAQRAVSMAFEAGNPELDSTPPTSAFSAPSGGANVSGTVAVEVTASDNVGVASVNLYVDGGLMAIDTAPPFAFAWNTTLLPNGAHILKARAFDAAGSFADATNTVNVSNSLIDFAPPTVAITSPANGSTAGNRTIAVAVAVSDNVGVSRVELYVDGAIKSTATTSPFTTNWNARRAATGPHTLQCRAYDGAGNAAWSAPITVYR